MYRKIYYNDEFFRELSNNVDEKLHSDLHYEIENPMQFALYSTIHTKIMYGNDPLDNNITELDVAIIVAFRM